MPKVLITAFGPYDRWESNASWMAMVALTRNLPANWAVMTRRYPVDFAAVQQRLAVDLSQRPDYALLLGQAPGSSAIRLEAFGVNVGGDPNVHPDDLPPLVDGGPAAYRSELPLGAWAAGLRAQGIPATVSHHAGTYLCNAALYLAHYIADKQGLGVKAAFIHLPLDLSQVAGQPIPPPSLSCEVSARAIRWILEQLYAEPLPATPAAQLSGG